MFRLCGGLVPAVIVAVVAIATLFTLPARADVLLPPVLATGTSAAGNPVSFRATFTTSGSSLFVELVNTSTFATRAPADVLSSFYFDVLQNGVRPTLSLAAAAGFVYEVRKSGTDPFVPGTLPGGATDLRALVRDAGTWQFRTMNPAVAPQLGFGIGTVGNSGLKPNNFDPHFVNQGDYSLYSTGTGTDIDPVGNLPGKLLVRGTATFAFTGLDPCQPVVVGDRFAFGLGTSPDSLIVAVPEPAAAALVVPGTLAVLLAAAHRRRRPPAAPRPRPDGAAAS